MNPVGHFRRKLILCGIEVGSELLNPEIRAIVVVPSTCTKETASQYGSIFTRFSQLPPHRSRSSRGLCAIKPAQAANSEDFAASQHECLHKMRASRLWTRRS